MTTSSTLDAKYSAALRQILKFEGGYVDDPVDPGGATNFGITQRTYDSWRRRQDIKIPFPANPYLPTRSVALIESSEVAAIYKEDFWLPMACDKLIYALALVCFDTAVQWGVHGASQLLAEAAGIPGATDPATIIRQACWTYATPQDLVLKIISARKAFRYNRVKRNPLQVRFLKGWLSRDNQLGTLALTALAATQAAKKGWLGKGS